jgi:uncharacterized membrane protein
MRLANQLSVRFELLRRYGSQRIQSNSTENAEARSMKLRAIGIRRWLQASSILIILGLLVEIVTLLWVHPITFVLFVFVGTVLIGMGILVYLTSLVFAVSPAPENRG